MPQDVEAQAGQLGNQSEQRLGQPCSEQVLTLLKGENSEVSASATHFNDGAGFPVGPWAAEPIKHLIPCQLVLMATF